jgi:hypothetical protein
MWKIVLMNKTFTLSDSVLRQDNIGPSENLSRLHQTFPIGSISIRGQINHWISRSREPSPIRFARGLKSRQSNAFR